MQFREAEKKQWLEHLEYDALEPLTKEQTEAVLDRIDHSRVLRCRWAYKDKNWAKRIQETEDGEGPPCREPGSPASYRRRLAS